MVTIALSAGSATTKKPKPARCEPGRFLVASTDAPLLGPRDGSLDIIELTAAGALSTAQCPATAVRVRARGTFTRLRTHWPACGTATRVRIKARIGAPSCSTMTGAIRAKGMPRRAFSATRTDVTTTTTLTPVSSTTTTTAIPCDTCAVACALPEGTTAGTTAGHADYGFGGGACPEMYSGPEVFYAATVPGGQLLTATATPTSFFDVALAVVLDCTDLALSCEGQANRHAEGGVEVITYQNPSGLPQTVFVVVDSPSPFAGNFMLDLQIGPGAP